MVAAQIWEDLQTTGVSAENLTVKNFLKKEDSQGAELIFTFSSISEAIIGWVWAWTSAWQDAKDHTQAQLAFFPKAPGAEAQKYSLSKLGGYQRWHMGNLFVQFKFYDLWTS